jgi:tetratricopeptide (TPR) repeat protein
VASPTWGALAAVVLLAAPVWAEEPDLTGVFVASGDAHYARRGEGAAADVASPAAIDLAITAYRNALIASPQDNGVTFRLLRALHFRAAFTGADEALQRKLYDEATELAQAAIDRVERRASGRTRLDVLRATPDAPELYYWAAACWGQWGLLHGKFASARKGVAGRVRDLATTVNDLDPTTEEGGGFRVLGRLHDQAPHIPLITGWVSGEKAIAYLRRSQEIGPGNHVTWYFLAEALLVRQRDKTAEAKDLLKRCADTAPHADYLVEDRHYARLARERLAGLP